MQKKDFKVVKKLSKKKPFYERHFFLSAFVGTFLAATVILTGLFIFIGGGSEAFAAALSQYKGAFTKNETAVKNAPSYLPELLKTLEEVNRLNRALVACDRRLEMGIEEHTQEKLKMEGLSMLADSNRDEIALLKKKIEAINLPRSLKDSDYEKLALIKDYMAKRADHAIYRQEHIGKLLSDMKSKKIRSVHGIYMEDTVKYMKLVKEIEHEYHLIYGAGGYGDLLAEGSLNNLEWAGMANLARQAEEGGNVAKAEEIYTTLTKNQDENFQGAGLVSLARLKREQGDYEASREFLEQAESRWKGASVGKGEYGACQAQGLL
jgi:hypothetical protein